MSRLLIWKPSRICHYVIHSSLGLSLRISLIAEVKFLLLWFCVIMNLILMYTHIKISRDQMSGSHFASYSGSPWFSSQPLLLVPQLRSVEVFLSFPNYNVGDFLEMDQIPLLHAQFITILICNSFYLSVMSTAATYSCVLQPKAQLHTLMGPTIFFVYYNSLEHIVLSFSLTY
jgi:hypothetical protein